MRRVLPLVAAAVALIALGPSPVAAQTGKKGIKFTQGTYRGTTVQESVAVDHRRLEFRIKKGKVTLLTEPVIRRGFCLSPPVFTLDGETPVKPLSRRGAFTFTKTFLGKNIDKITGRFVDDKKIKGRAIYNFAAAEECAEGVAKVKFTVTSGKKKKKGDQQQP